MQTTDADNFFRTEAAVQDEEARRQKSIRNRDVGDPIELVTKINDFCLRDQTAWVAESTNVIRKVDLETGKVVKVYKGHKGPVTCVVLYDLPLKDGNFKTVLISGSWDKSIKVWDAESKALISDTSGHDDFVKTLVVIPSERLLVTGSSDKTIKIWDLAVLSDETISAGNLPPLQQMASLSGHRRPPETLIIVDKPNLVLISGDSMGVIKTWSIALEDADSQTRRVRAQETGELRGHPTGINDINYFRGFLWVASTDKTMSVQRFPLSTVSKAHWTIDHTESVRCVTIVPGVDDSDLYAVAASGDTIVIYDASELLEEDSSIQQAQSTMKQSKEIHLLNIIDAHSQPITSLGVWLKRQGEQGDREQWLVSGSLDGTLRRWRFADALVKKIADPSAKPNKAEVALSGFSAMTEEEERELQELLEDD